MNQENQPKTKSKSLKDSKKYKKDPVELLNSLAKGTLKSFVNACRKNGVLSFKGFGVELVLESQAPKSYYQRKKSTAESSDTIETDQILSEEAALYWSSAGIETPLGGVQ